MVEGPAEGEPNAARPHMPGYSILPADQGRGLLSWVWASARLARARRYWLATARDGGTPHLMPLWAVWLDGALYFSTGPRSVKGRNLARRGDCSVGVEDPEVDVIIEGVAERLAEPAALSRVAEVYAGKYGEAPSDAVNSPYFVLRPRRAFAFIESAEEFGGSATRWTFE